MTSIEIPISGSAYEVLEIEFDNLPNHKELIEILTQEQALPEYYYTLAIQYYKQKRYEEFREILEEAVRSSVTQQHYGKANSNSFKDYALKILSTLAAYYVQLASREKNKRQRELYYDQATGHFSRADVMFAMDQSSLLGKGMMALYKGETDRADEQFDFILDEDNQSIPAMLGKASVMFGKGQYQDALTLYKNALRLKPNGPACIRVGIGLCLLKLNHLDKARVAFERALQLDSEDIYANVCLAILNLNAKEKTREGTMEGMKLLKKAYEHERSNPVVLNQLANHFFFKRDNEKVQSLAMDAFHNCNVDEIKSQSCYFLARSYHSMGDYDSAFQYYYQARKLNNKFILPYYGLGQMYLYKKEKGKAIECLEKVLASNPDNYESLKILGSVYANSSKTSHQEKAVKYLKKVIDMVKYDYEAYIEYAFLLESSHPRKALDAYRSAIYIMEEDAGAEIPPELKNNVGAIHHKLKEYELARQCYEEALSCGKDEKDTDLQVYYSTIRVTVTYNIALLEEDMHNYTRSEEMYKEILKDHPKYIDCYMRLGCIYKQLGKKNEAMNWFKEALAVQPENPEVWSMMGCIHLEHKEYQPAQKKFEHILAQRETNNDHYALCALGNIYLTTANPFSKGREGTKSYKYAIDFFSRVLKYDPKNLYAANGIGAVLAERGHFKEAKEIFQQVRENTSAMPNVWINLAHVYVEVGQYVNAIKMYENCMKKFFDGRDAQLNLYIARAMFLYEKYDDCKAELCKAQHLCPHDSMIRFNIALAQQKKCEQILKVTDKTPSLAYVDGIIEELKGAKESFEHLAELKQKNSPYNPATAAEEAKYCDVLLAHINHKRKHIEKIEGLVSEQRIRRLKEVERVREQNREEKLRKQAEDEKKKKELEAQRLEYIERTRNLTYFEETSKPERSTKKEKKKSGKSKEKNEDDFIVSSSSDNDEDGGGKEWDESKEKKYSSASEADDKLSSEEEASMSSGQDSDEDDADMADLGEEEKKEKKAEKKQKKKEAKEARRKERKERKAERKAERRNKRKRQAEESGDDGEAASAEQTEDTPRKKKLIRRKRADSDEGSEAVNEPVGAGRDEKGESNDMDVDPEPAAADQAKGPSVVQDDDETVVSSRKKRAIVDSDSE
eukprot:Nk52_evm12s327 gene=Nk52_evmTU12s327